MSTRILFVLMSAVHRADAIDQLAAALAPHQLLVHHDFSQSPDFVLSAGNVKFVPSPRKTGWAVWGFADGIFHSLRHALQTEPFDYLQLLSPTCLPIKPLADFERYIASNVADANFSFVNLDDDVDGLMSVGYRAFSQEGTLRHRVLRRMTGTYYRDSKVFRDISGIQLRERDGPLSPSSGPATTAPLGLTQRAALLTLAAARRGLLGAHAFKGDFIPCFGSTWFGARRNIVEWIVSRFEQADVQGHFPRVRIADEFLVPSLLHQSGARRGPSNHHICGFDGANPGWIDLDGIDELRASPAFFARKFRDDPALPVRKAVLDRLVHCAAAPAPVEPAVAVPQN